MLTLKSLTHYSNVLELTNPNHFLNTTTISESCYTPADWCSDAPGFSETVVVDVKPSYFSGYVFRGDTRPPDHIFEIGFDLQPTSRSETRYQSRVTGSVGGYTRACGISTSICASMGGKYAFEPSRRDPFFPSPYSGYVYLIDATEFKGFAIPTTHPDDPLAKQNPILREIDEVNFASNIPESYIVGIVWTRGNEYEGMENCQGIWSYRPTRLWLAVNPNFTKPVLLTDTIMKGMDAARQVQSHFNEHPTSSADTNR
ncbi:hypothetical protein [Endozoicomonas euniceicola]|uniref:Uncharacterized protein n=1 Tax=Endozoicomonas euniceicola TaxID=1234143 RepID=A0ABY6GWZ1_9GAMM|nr:hypothetical protein [Endozoicomonas euniceicola]UYM17290.1 hypothetical protein NX720_05030 [Endozoicomonas euniceicola]